MNSELKSIPNYIHQLQLENFTCFEKADLQFSKGINVLIGENGTGKTHILKLLYLIEESPILIDIIGAKPYINVLKHHNDFQNIFKVEKAGQLVRLQNKELTSRVNTNMTTQQLSFELSEDNSLTQNLNVKPRNDFSSLKKECLFLPPQQMLSTFDGFVAAYENRESSFDQTYYDLAKKLSLLPLKGEKLEEAQKLLKSFKEKIAIDVFQKGGKFFIRYEDYDLEAALEADGVNKIAQLIYLILNGSLNRNTILFWDEPENSLNPRWIKLLADFLKVLALEGVQIFVATHDYLLSHQLSLFAEYKEDINEDVGEMKVPDMKFFCLAKGKSGTEIFEGKHLGEIPNNPILDEFARHYDLEERLEAKYIDL